MSWIEEIDHAQAEGRLARTFKGAADPNLGRPANVITVHSHRPQILDAHLALYRRVVKASVALAQSERESVATLVSAANDCIYCTVHHWRACLDVAKEEGRDDGIGALLHALIRLGRHDEAMPDTLGSRATTVAAYALKLTRTPGGMVEGDVVSLRDVGLDDGMITELNQVVAYFNYVNRIVLGLGVELEREYESYLKDLPW